MKGPQASAAHMSPMRTNGSRIRADTATPSGMTGYYSYIIIMENEPPGITKMAAYDHAAREKQCYTFGKRWGPGNPLPSAMSTP